VTRKVIWAEPARDDLLDILVYIARDNLAAAENTVGRIEKVAENLAVFATGRAGRMVGIYEKPVLGLPYILAYEITRGPDGEQIVFILHVVHAARDWQPGSWPSE
jgi:plasmid stabilization system protein ParE